MTFTKALAGVTEYSVAYLIHQDGKGGGPSIEISNSDLLNELVSRDIWCHFRYLLGEDVVPNSQDFQRALLLGDASCLASQDLRNPYCIVDLLARTGWTGWLVDADVDPAALGRGKLIVIGPPWGPSDCLVTLKYQHSIIR